MKVDVQHKFIWGWLRLLLGMAQMSLVAMSVGTLITIGLHPVTYAFIVAATVAAIISRITYRGKPGPNNSREERYANRNQTL